jgi:dipeptidyl aminopeptidase/acylaminoacyl peptidase
MTFTARIIFAILVLASVDSPVFADDADRPLFQPADLHRIKGVSDIAISPDGSWIAYQVSTTNVDKDSFSSDLYMVSWDAKTRIQLTHTEDSGESHPRFSPDGRYIAFLAARTDGKSEESDDPKVKSQVWLLNRAGGEAQRLTELPGGVSGFEWSHDSTRLAIVSKDAEEKIEKGEDGPSHDTPPPIVIDRYQFKRDVEGYLGDRYERIYAFDVATRNAILLTPGAFDSREPVWSPDDKRIAFSSKRQGDPDRHDNSDIYVMDAVEGAAARQLTVWDGADSGPAFSPDGKWIAYLQSGPVKYSGYDPVQIAVVPSTGGEVVLPTPDLDRNVSDLRWSEDGKSLYFLLANDRVQSVARVPFKGGKTETLYPSRSEPGVASAFVVSSRGVVAVTTFGQRPNEIYNARTGAALTNHNREFLDSVALASVEGYDATSKDGTTVGSMLLKPPGFKKGVRYPTIALIHGGPIAQDGFEFDAMSQALAAQGYLVVNPNYRGSSGRGSAFSRAIYADWGNLEIQDIHAVIDQLVADGLADPDRLGIGGWSYGGMSTNYAIATDTRFAAAVSGAGIANALTGYGTDQYITQYENEIGLPWESVEPYAKISYPFLHADRIKTPTLYMCGEKDFNVPLINSEQMYQALRSLEVPTQLIIYPDQFHGLSKPSYIQDRVERMIDWYGRYLQAE